MYQELTIKEAQEHERTTGSKKVKREKMLFYIIYDEGGNYNDGEYEMNSIFTMTIVTLYNDIGLYDTPPIVSDIPRAN
jgi:hypothetical protein